MFNIKLYNFAKKNNSTLIPSEAGDNYSCVLKSDTSLVNPVITIDFGSPELVPRFTYAYIEAFSRYYYIDNWVYSRGLWTAELRVDVLASYKAAIGDSTQYVARAAAAYDSKIIDSLYPFKTGATLITHTTPVGWQTDMSSGFFVMTLAGGRYGTTHYVVGSYNMHQFSQRMYSTSFLKDNLLEEDVDFVLDKNILNPINYITDVKWFPINSSLSPVPVGIGEEMHLGWFNSRVEATALSRTTTVTFTRSIAIPKHPQTNDIGTWINGSTASRLQLEYQPFGSIALDPTVYADKTTLYLITKVDLISGVGTCWVSPTASQSDATNIMTATVAVPIMLSQQTQNLVGGVAGLASAAISAFLPSPANVVGAANGISSALSAMMPQLNTKGSEGSLSPLLEPIRLVGTFYTMVDEDLSAKGRPLLQNKRINTLAGYIQCEDVHLAIQDCTAPELDAIITHLSTGFFYE